MLVWAYDQRVEGRRLGVAERRCLGVVERRVAGTVWRVRVKRAESTKDAQYTSVMACDLYPVEVDGLDDAVLAEVAAWRLST